MNIQLEFHSPPAVNSPVITPYISRPCPLEMHHADLNTTTALHTGFGDGMVFPGAGAGPLPSDINLYCIISIALFTLALDPG
jgi:hypothetical protein